MSKSKSPSNRPTGASRPVRKTPAQGRRFTPEQKEHALSLVASGMKKVDVAEAVGTTVTSLRRWAEAMKVAETTRQAVDPGAATRWPPSSLPPPSASTHSPEAAAVTPTGAPSQAPSPFAPKDPGQGLSEPEKAAILELKKKHPSMGPAQIRAQLKRFKGWRISVKAIARVLRAHGYEPVHVHGRPQGPEPIRFESPRPNHMWQADFAEMRVGGERRQLLVILDDFSRYCVVHRLCESPNAESTIEALQEAIARHGKPESVRTDRGGGFLSKQLTDFLEAELIDHVVGRAYHPQGGGKVESLIGTIRRELWDVEHFEDLSVASARLTQFLEDYNEQRAHMGLDGLTPADRYHGRAQRVLSLLDAVSRKRQGALSQHGSQELFEEITGSHSGAPMEVLRLVIVDGQMQLRLCGARVVLGPVVTG